jgi:hypothetical protein
MYMWYAKIISLCSNDTLQRSNAIKSDAFIKQLVASFHQTYTIKNMLRCISIQTTCYTIRTMNIVICNLVWTVHFHLCSFNWHVQILHVRTWLTLFKYHTSTLIFLKFLYQDFFILFYFFSKELWTLPWSI